MKTSKLRVNDLCQGNEPVTGEFPAQRANNAENVSLLWRHHDHCSNRNWLYVRILIHKRHPISHPDGWAIGAFYDDFRESWLRYNGTAK